jgi:hypothetical protein
LTLFKFCPFSVYQSSRLQELFSSIKLNFDYEEKAVANVGACAAGGSAAAAVLKSQKIIIIKVSKNNKNDLLPVVFLRTIACCPRLRTATCLGLVKIEGSKALVVISTYSKPTFACDYCSYLYSHSNKNTNNHRQKGNQGFKLTSNLCFLSLP